MSMSQHEKYCVGMRGVYAVAEILSKLSYAVSVTHGNAKATDILATDESGEKVFSVQVKSTGSQSFWYVGNKPIPYSDRHIYVFVRFFDDSEQVPPEIYVVPSKDAEEMRLATGLANKTDVRRTAVREGDYLNNWNLFM